MCTAMHYAVQKTRTPYRVVPTLCKVLLTLYVHCKPDERMFGETITPTLHCSNWHSVSSETTEQFPYRNA